MVEHLVPGSSGKNYRYVSVKVFFLADNNSEDLLLHFSGVAF